MEACSLNLAPLEEAVVEMVSFLKTDMDAFDTEPPKVKQIDENR